MIKRILRYLAIALVAFITVFFTHQYTLESQDLMLSYSLLNMYAFHAIASVIVYVLVEMVADKMPNQAGYAFMAGIFMKIGFFILIFNAVVFPEVALPKFQRVSLIVPLFLFLILEAVFASKLLNAKQY